MKRTLIAEASKKVGESIKVCGWIKTYRSHGKIIFIDLRDISGILQVVILPELPSDVLKIAKDMRTEWVVEIIGKINKRPGGTQNQNLTTGDIEMTAESITVLSEAKTLPFDINTDGYEVNEESRMKYRYVDLRRERLKRNLIFKQEFLHFVRTFLKDRGFIEIDTPSLTKSTPEGARDFLVPSRLQPEKFYALPQSPQQYKQLLMVAGLEKYYQIARCFRDEDSRADRAYGEFTQLDIEMSFTTQEEIFVLIENLYKEITEKILKKKVLKFPFPRLSYNEVIKKYNTDKPDLRPDKNDPNVLAFCFIKDFPLFEWKEKEKRWDSMHHPFTAPKEEDISMLDKNPGKVRSYQHDFVLNGFEVGGGSLRISNPEIQRKIFKIMGHTEEQIQKKFGHLLQAFEYGVPPHGGIAPGIDRFLMVVLQEPSLREVMAFPMTSGGQTAVMEAPSEVDKEQLKELGIEIASKKIKNVSSKKK